MPATATLRSPAPPLRLPGRFDGRSRLGPVGLRLAVDRRGPRLINDEEVDHAGPTDDELLVRYRDARRHEDFAELVRRYSGELGRYLARYLGDAALAEDVLQDTFLQIHVKCGLYRDGWRARPWLYAVAVHRAVDALRRARRQPALCLDSRRSEDDSAGPGTLADQLGGAGPGPLDVLQERERQQWVRESIGRLPEPLRQVLCLAYDRDLSYAEIARVAGIPIGTVRSRLHMAVSRLRTMAERQDRLGGR